MPTSILVVDVLYTFLILGVIATAVLMLRVRIRLEVSRDRRVLFAGLGRTGVELDFVSRRKTLRLCGARVRVLRPRKKAPAGAEPEAEKAGKPDKPGAKRVRPARKILRILPQCTTALWSYSLDMIKAVILEQAEGEIEAGFDSPDMTGRMFGFYQAALAAVPSVAGRIRYTPDWTGPSFAGAVRCSVGLPLYKLGYLTLVLIWRLPVREIIKVAIGTKKGAQDG